jgi:hypothetical protein
MKLYTHPNYPGMWIADMEDGRGSYLAWPTVPGGWADRVEYPRPPGNLTPADPALARGTGAPGTGKGRPSNEPGEAGKPMTIRIDDGRRARVAKAAKRAGVTMSRWVVSAIDAALTKERSR